MSTTTDVLPLEVGTTCGYCGRHLVMTAEHGFRCPHCAPQLAEIKTCDEWAAWMKKNRRRP